MKTVERAPAAVELCCVVSPQPSTCATTCGWLKSQPGERSAVAVPGFDRADPESPSAKDQRGSPFWLKNPLVEAARNFL